MKGRKPQLSAIPGGAIAGGCPGPAAWLSPFAKEEWRRVAPVLHERGHLGPDTIATVESYCVSVGVIRECYQPLAASQGDLLAPGGMQTPAQTKTMFAAMREARLFAAELGLTPHRRAQQAAEPGETSHDGWEADLLA